MIVLAFLHDGDLVAKPILVVGTVESLFVRPALEDLNGLEQEEVSVGRRGKEGRGGDTYDVLVGENVDAKLDLSKLAVTDCVADSIRVEHAPLWMGRVAGPGDLGGLEDGRGDGGMGNKRGGWELLEWLNLG
jgi:hypothetical protein